MRSEDAEKTGGVGLLSKYGSVRGRVPLGRTCPNLMMHPRIPLWLHCPTALACKDSIEGPSAVMVKVATVDWLNQVQNTGNHGPSFFSGPFQTCPRW